MARHLTRLALLLVLLGGCTTAQIDAFNAAQPVALRSGEPIGPPAADPYEAGKAHLGHGRLGGLPTRSSAARSPARGRTCER